MSATAAAPAVPATASSNTVAEVTITRRSRSKSPDRSSAPSKKSRSRSRSPKTKSNDETEAGAKTPTEAKRKTTKIPRQLVVISDAESEAYKNEHWRLNELFHREVGGDSACSYRFHVPTILGDDKLKDGKYSCAVCQEPITESVARKPRRVPIRDDSDPGREMDANGKYYDLWKPSGYWIVHDGEPESFDPSHCHFKCFRSMDDNNFPLFI